MRIAAATAEEKRHLEGELMLHQCRAERAYQQLKEDASTSKATESVDMSTFDLQQSLPTPKKSTNVVFYMRQMWTYTSEFTTVQLTKATCTCGLS